MGGGRACSQLDKREAWVGVMKRLSDPSEAKQRAKFDVRMVWQPKLKRFKRVVRKVKGRPPVDPPKSTGFFPWD